jgi:hypothetical protein
MAILLANPHLSSRTADSGSALPHNIIACPLHERSDDAHGLFVIYVTLNQPIDCPLCVIHHTDQLGLVSDRIWRRRTDADEFSAASEREPA